MQTILKLNLQRDFTFEEELFDEVPTFENDENGQPILGEDGQKVQKLDDKGKPVFVKESRGKLTFTFHFKTNQELDFTEIRKMLMSKAKDKKVEEQANEYSMNIYWTFLCQSLIGCTGIGDSNGVPIQITKSDGTIDINAQNVVFQWIQSRKELMEKIVEASLGVTSKK